MEVDSGYIDQEGDVPQCELLLAAESDEDCRATVDVSFIDVHLLQGTEKDGIGGGAVFD